MESRVIKEEPKDEIETVKTAICSECITDNCDGKDVAYYPNCPADPDKPEFSAKYYEDLIEQEANIINEFYVCDYFRWEKELEVHNG